MPESLTDYPERLRFGTQKGSVVYQRAPNLYALRESTGRTPSTDGAPMATILADNGDTLRIYKGVPDKRAPASDDRIAVYTEAGSGRMVVPSGRVFVRLADGQDVARCARAFAKAGYQIAQTLSYAPNAAWLQASDDGIASALQGIEKLEALPDVVNVEPQFLSPRVQR